MSLTEGTRAVIVWDNDPSYSKYELQPGADLDLEVVDASDSVVASSTS